MKWSFRTILSIVTIVLIAVILYFSRHELVDAWRMLGQVNLWILALAIPLLAVSYLAAGEMVFSYLRQKRLIGHLNPLTLMRISLELNFVNHVLPSGGVSGISYVNWRLGKFGVSSGRATMAQIVRYVVGFGALITLLVAAILLVTIDGSINRWTIFTSFALVSIMAGVTVGGVYIVKNPIRLDRFAVWVSRVANGLVRRVSLGKKQQVVSDTQVKTYFADMHADFKELVPDKRLLIKPYLWGIIFTICDVAMYWVVFWALGTPINPAPILIAYGVASFAGFIIATPGGTGVYEMIMVAIIAMAGIGSTQTIAGIVLARVIILLVAIAFGYIAYQLALVKYGGKRNQPNL